MDNISPDSHPDIEINQLDQFEESPISALPLSYFLTNYAILAFISGAILLLDQLTKSWVRANIAPYGSWYPIESLSEILRIVNLQNSGSAFGFFKNGSLVFTILAVVVTIVIIYYFPQIPNKDWPIKLALGLQLGGAFGNLYDRLLFGGSVTDFVAIGNFPVFNVADSSITGGGVILILSIWIADRNEKLSRRAALDDSPELEVGEQV